MKTTIQRFFLLLVCIATAASAFAQEKLSAQQWQDDLRFLQKTVHTTYPFLFKNFSVR